MTATDACELECERWRPGSNGGARLESVDPLAGVDEPVGVDEADDEDDPCACVWAWAC